MLLGIGILVSMVMGILFVSNKYWKFFYEDANEAANKGPVTKVDDGTGF